MEQEIYTDEYFMQMALSEAEKAFEAGEIPVGAVIVSDKHILARTHNLTETLRDATAHAEILALTAAFEHLGSKYLPDCTIYVTVEPCPMCAGALAWAQIGKLVYATRDPRKGYSNYSPSLLHKQTRVDSGILAGRAEKLMEAFFDKLRKH